MTETIDMKAMGLLGTPSEEDLAAVEADSAASQAVAAAEAAQAEYLNSPLGRIEQAMSALMFATETFGMRLDQCEKYLMYLLSKDPEMGQKVKAMAAALDKESAEKAAAEGTGDDGETKR